MLKKARELLQKHYGYPDFRPGQAEIIQNILEGRDTLAVMPTGAGKSLCFQLPALLLPGITLVISPLISLMKDQVDALTAVGIPSAFINSSLSASEVSATMYQAGCGEYKLLYIAPERLETEQFQVLVRQMEVSFVAIDEAHCVSQWGHDFRPSYRAVGTFISRLSKPPVIGAFTATATEHVKQDIIELLGLKQPETYFTGFDRPNLSFTVLRGENKQDFILHYLQENREQSGIIYAATRKEVDILNTLLSRQGYAAGKYHAGMTDEERRVSQEDFIRDNISIMVATNAFGMGIDKPDVRYVIHYNMPKNMEAYYQEAGRAGRDGEPGECILLFGAQDVMLQKYLIEQTVYDVDRKSSELNKLQSMVDYCHTPDCLRNYILHYFGEEGRQEECGNCGNCREDAELTDITIEAQKIFSCILRMKERFGTTLIAEVLKGSKNRKVLEQNFDRLSTYGLLKQYSLQEIKDQINRLIATEYLHLTESEYPVVKLTPRGIEVVRGQAKVWQKVPRKQQKAIVDNSLFALLRTLRKEIADREKVPPYVVFADVSLKEMAEILPRDETALRQIKGVGEVKLARYGDAFLRVISEYAAEHHLQSVSKAPSSEPVEEELPSHLITLKLYRSGQTLEQIAAARDLKLLTIQEHLVRCSLEGHDIDWSPLIPRRYEALILEKIEKLGAGRLKLLKEALPEEINYTAIKAVICKYKMSS